MNYLYEQWQKNQEEHYNKAKEDFLKAIESWNHLTPEQKTHLFNELTQLAIWNEIFNHMHQ